MDKKIFSNEEAAEFLGISPDTLSNLRYQGKSPPYSQPARKVYYFKEDLIKWLEDHKRR